jgi:ABC-2 type transport system ATP-binding protein
MTDAAAAAKSDGQALARLSGARKRYGEHEALRGIDLAVPAGRMLALLGPNGAGKTTAIDLLCGLRLPDGGTVELFGGDPLHPRSRQPLGVTPQNTGFPEALRVSEVVELVRAHYHDPVPTDELLERFGLSELGRRQTGGLSGGQKRRLAVALAFAGRPRLVILDEPTTGLDVDARRGLWQVLRAELAAGTTILLTTHYIEEAEALADDVAVLADGAVTARGSVNEIKAHVELTKVSLTAAELPELPGVVSAETDRGRTVLHTTDADALVRALVASGAEFSGLEISRVSLEEAFLVLTEGGATDAASGEPSPQPASSEAQ